ncbi:MAG: DNA-3-methyladenine glycosylase [Saprospiraceae bacterium]
MIDSNAVLQHLGKDVRLQPLLNQFPFPVFDPNREVFSSLLKSIVSQQLSVKAAATIHQRFLQLFPDMEPDAEIILSLSDQTLRSVGLSRQKSSYIQNVAQHFMEEKLLDTDWSSFTDQEIIQDLTRIKGVGQWTVEMVLMFTLQRPNVLPVADLGIQQAFEKLCGLDLQQKKKALYIEMQSIAKSWEPYRTFACIYLWQFKDLAS